MKERILDLSYRGMLFVIYEYQCYFLLQASFGVLWLFVSTCRLIYLRIYINNEDVGGKAAIRYSTVREDSYT